MAGYSAYTRRLKTLSEREVQLEILKHWAYLNHIQCPSRPTDRLIRACKRELARRGNASSEIKSLTEG